MPDSLEQLLDRLGGPRRAMILAAGIVATLLIFGISKWATRPEYVPVFQGVPIEEMAQLTDKLEGAGVPFRLERGGSDLTVQTADLARARVLLAKGGLPMGGRPGMELFDQPSWGMTDFTQRINYRRALEGELQRTIGKMRGIESAQVHLALHETSSFRTPDRKVEASVVLKLRNGATPTPDVVQGITHLVASSVDGLQAEQVTVVDDGGQLLSQVNDPTSLAGLSSRQLAMQREVEGHLQSKAEQLLADIVGRQNVRVQVAASVNFDKVERTVEAVDPDRQATSTEQKSEIVPGAQGGAAQTNTAVQYENSRSLETFSGAIGNITRMTVSVLVNERRAPSPLDSTRMEWQPRSAEELVRIETLVRNAVGIDAERGDVISVVSAAFDGRPEPVAAPAPTVWQRVEEVHRPVLTVLGLLLVFFIALTTVKALRAPQPELALASPELAPALGSGAEHAGNVPPSLAQLYEKPPPPINVEMRDRVLGHVEADPETAAKLIRAWLKEV